VTWGRGALVFALCLLVWTLTNMDQALFGYAIPGIITEFQQPLQSIGTVLTISFLAAAVLVVLAGLAADRWGRELTLTLLLLSSAIAVGLQGVADNFALLTLFRALAFGLSGGLSPITNALVVESVAARHRGVAIGVLQCGYPLGWFLASLAAAPLLGAYGWRSICFVAFAVAPVALLTGALLWRRGPVGPARVSVRATASAAGALATLFSPAYRLTSLACMLVFFAFGGAYAGSAFFFPTFFTEARGYSPADAAALVGLSNGIGVFGYLAAALVGEYLLSRRWVFMLWCWGGAAALLGLLWLSSGHAQDLWWYGATAALFYGSQAVVLLLVAESYPAEIRATALAACGSAPLSLGFALFPLLVPQAVAGLGWQSGLTLMVAPLLVLSGIAAWPLRGGKLAAA
jgi:MFS family permease